MRIIKYPFAFFRGLLVILTMAICLLVYAFTRIFKKHTKESGLKLRRFWIKNFTIPILNIKIEKVGSPIDTPALYISNHRSFVDPAVISAYLDAFVIAKAEIASYPVLNKGAEVTGIIYVKREDKESRVNARNAFVDVVKSGHNILVYPEGTTSLLSDTLPFKKGTFFASVEQDISVVPVAIEYRDQKDMWTISNLFFQFLNQFGSWQTNVKLHFGPSMSASSGEELADKCQTWVRNELSTMQKDWITFDFNDFV